MIIDTQSAAPQGAAPASIPAGLGARLGDAPATHSTFASLVAQLSDSAPAGRARGTRAPTAPAAGDQPLPARSARASESPVPNDGGRASVPGTPSDASGSDETGSVPVDTTAFVTGAPADPAAAVPTWLWALGDLGAPPASDLTTAVASDTVDAAPIDAAQPSDGLARMQPIATAGSRTSGPTPPAPTVAKESTGQAARAVGAAATSARAVTPDPFTSSRAVDGIAFDRAPHVGTPSSATPAAQANGPTGQAVEADATSPHAAASNRIGLGTLVDRITLDDMNRSSTAFSTPEAQANGLPGQAVEADATSPQAAASNRIGLGMLVDRITRDGMNRSSAAFSTPPATTQADGLTGHAVEADDTSAQAPGSYRFGSGRLVDRIAIDRARRSGTPFSTTTAAAQTNGSADQPASLAGAASSVPARVVDADATSAEAAAPDRLASARFVDRIALDRAIRSGTPSSTTTAASLTSVAATDPASGSENRQRASDQGLSDRASRDEAQAAAGRAMDAAAALLRVEYGASGAARTVEILGAGSLATAAPASTPVLVPAGAPIAIPNEGDLRHQIVQGIKFQWREGVGDVKLTLHPEYLGGMRIALRVDQGGVTAQVSADSASVRAWVMANESLLRQGLAEQGLTLSRLVVTDEDPASTPEHESRRRAPQQDTPDPPEPRRSDSATFEIVL